MPHESNPLAEPTTCGSNADWLGQHRELVFNTIGEGIHSIDLDGIIVFENPAAARLLGWDGSELIGRSAHATMHHTRGDGTPYPRCDCHIHKTLQTGLSARINDEVFWRKDGTSFPVEYTTTPVRDASGRLLGAVVVFTDITDRKRAEAQLRQSNDRLLDVSRRAGMAEVAIGVLHNVGNVLNSVNVAARMVDSKVRKSKAANLGKVISMLKEHEGRLGAFLDQGGKGRDLVDYLEKLAGNLALEQTDVLTEMESLCKNVEHVKEIVKAQQSYAVAGAVLEPLNIRELLEDALRIDLPARQRAGVNIVRKYENTRMIRGDKHKLLQILINLISNARQAMNASEIKTLTLMTQTGPQGEVRVSVRDTGCGIAPENLSRVFTHGFTTRQNGHGFGLHSSALAAQEMTGSLTVQSDGPGQGATFTLSFPAALPISSVAV